MMVSGLSFLKASVAQASVAQASGEHAGRGGLDIELLSRRLKSRQLCTMFRCSDSFVFTRLSSNDQSFSVFLLMWRDGSYLAVLGTLTQPP
jgi:hypothetical protein